MCGYPECSQQGVRGTLHALLHPQLCIAQHDGARALCATSLPECCPQAKNLPGMCIVMGPDAGRARSVLRLGTAIMHQHAWRAHRQHCCCLLTENNSGRWSSIRATPQGRLRHRHSKPGTPGLPALLGSTLFAFVGTTTHAGVGR